ncbi:branched-chain amino acid ABC transporter permease [Ramlibacter sp. RBP-2]|uniref:Branched-chain amino acid ABC transporter permease n=1 Tax=Ramlibacter lithotrophicus TaxID=2606681 RepID=A0A7X6I911_9BURK|nr:branched-chain amino acid ABC transporter permease [Ramlibacter lithotrophicus]NKE68886.1 branched-chain amino acid ABC transporter permease [Ramlibacter lithotrophicus]
MNFPVRQLVLVAIVLAAGIASAEVFSGSVIDVLIVALWFAFLCQTWNITGGMAGQFSFAHPVYVACGGYTSTILFLHLQVSPWIGMFAGAVLAMGFAALLCWINFRQQLPMLTYALITLAVTFVTVIALQSFNFLGGHEGLVIPRGNSPATFRFTDKNAYLYIVLVAVCLMLLLSLVLRNSRFGVRLVAIRDNQDAARMLGVDVLKVTMISSTLSAGLGALGGTFYAHYLSVIDPSISQVDLAVQIVLMTAVGGIGTVWGPFLGPLLLVPVERALSREFVQLAGLGNLFYGLVIIVVLLGLRDGLVTWVSKRLRSRRMRRHTLPGQVR